MIHDVDETIRQFVRRDALPGTDIDVAFDAPTKDWASRRTGPVVDLYLYDIREDVQRREVGRIALRAEEGIVEKRVVPPRWFKLSYLVTAWTQRAEDEHRLLSVLLHCFLTRDCLPKELLTNDLGGGQGVVPYTIGLPPPSDRALSDVWSAMGGELKPSLDFAVFVPFEMDRQIEVGAPVEGPLGVDLTDVVDGGVDRRRPPRVPWPGPAGDPGSASEAATDTAASADGGAPAATKSKAATKASPSKAASKSTPPRKKPGSSNRGSS